MSQNVDSTTFKVNPKFVQTGTSSIRIASPGASGLAAQVSFPEPFQNTPRVIATINSGSGTGAAITTLYHSETGFSALARYVVATTDSTGSFDWVAIDITQPPFIPSDQ